MWNIHKATKAILIALGLFAAGYAWINPTSYIGAFNTWDIELINIIGMILGMPLGEGIVEELKRES